eukprot:TRINITY_DN14226_c0_g1_i1.p1 TRINITY_DN14226_c0_g1~~TRINITY_DN14226_c0_g1_i1.p1  ORF type:complete len:576 (-),score=90.03 TRINITY_DN14226_c0_g1_i1:106-1833(-)
MANEENVPPPPAPVQKLDDYHLPQRPGYRELDHRAFHGMIAWLSSLGLQRYAANFKAHEVDIETLPNLTESDLISMGIDAIGPRRRILAACEALARTFVSQPSLFLGESWAISPSELVWGGLIGTGNFGDVYQASYRGQTVAVKRMKRELTDSELQAFAREVEIVSSLRSPYVIMFIGASFLPPDYFLVMEYAERGTLHSVLQSKGIELTPDLRLNMLWDVARGMTQLHMRSPPLIHRDLTSFNILVDKNWRCKVADFGVSRTHGEHEVVLTQPGHLRWTAPELTRALQYDERVDVFSFGLLMWEVLTGSLPFSNHEPAQAANRMAYEGDRPTMPDGIPRDLQKLIRCCWADAPVDRPSFVDIVAQLETIIGTLDDDNVTLMTMSMDAANSAAGGAYARLGVSVYDSARTIVAPTSPEKPLWNTVNGVMSAVSAQTAVVASAASVVLSHRTSSRRVPHAARKLKESANIQTRIKVGYTRQGVDGWLIFVKCAEGRLATFVKRVVFSIPGDGDYESIREPFEHLVVSPSDIFDVQLRLEFLDFLKKKPQRVTHRIVPSGDGDSREYIIEFDVNNSV